MNYASLAILFLLHGELCLCSAYVYVLCFPAGVSGRPLTLCAFLCPISAQLGVLQAEPVVVQRSSAVLCTILVIGLLVAAGLIAGYMWMNHRRSNNKGMRLVRQ